MSPRAPRIVCALLAFALLQPAYVGLARADRTLGLSLYDEADKLTKSGRWPQACEAFAASQKELPRPVTLLRLGDCYERIGKTASAWATFREAMVAARAAQTNPEFDGEKERRREAEASRRRDEAEKKLTRLRVAVTKPVAGLSVRRDGSEIPAAGWGAALAIDPGTITVEASATGYESWKQVVEVAGEGKTIDVTVPELTPSAVTPSLGPASPPPLALATPSATPTATTAPPRTSWSPAPDATSAGSTQRTVGLVILGAGIAGLGVGGGLWGAARSRANGADCDANGFCATQSDVDRRASAHSMASAGNVVFGVGAALAVGGLVLWLTGSSEEPRSGGASIGLSPGGLVVGGAF